MDFHIIIPARFGSTRLPGKILIDIEGKPLIQRVYERALSYSAASVTIATDHEQIAQAAVAFGAQVCMTSVEHPTGTDRLAEAVSLLGFKEEDIVVNVQGDEPFLPRYAIQQVVEAILNNPTACTTTLCTPIHAYEELMNPNIVKVVFDHSGFALYFSRAPIPFDRALNTATTPLGTGYYRHLGLYAYRVKTLKQYLFYSKPVYETLECLEQIRILWHGGKIHVSTIEELLPPGIDTEADLIRARLAFSKEAALALGVIIHSSEPCLWGNPSTCEEGSCKWSSGG